MGRYYTDATVSRLLVASLPARTPSSLLDLGAGEGALALEASSRWKCLDLVTVDVDHHASRVLAQQLQRRGFAGRHRHVQQDALEVDLCRRLSQEMKWRPSAAVCNPPFLVPAWRKGYCSIVEDAGFSGALPAITSTDAATLFLAQNLRLMEMGGTVAIIVPDSLVSASKYQRFRETLLAKYDLQQAIRLPRGAFAGTDALAHVFVVAKRKPANDLVRLSVLPALGAKVKSIYVDRDRAAKRLDYFFHASQQQQQHPPSLALADIVVDLRRGSFNSAEVRASPAFVLHTTDIHQAMRGTWFDFTGGDETYRDERFKSAVIAEAGDILLSRVGRNAADKVIGVLAGSIAISDCLYRLRVGPDHRVSVLRSLTSAAGESWLKAHAYGVAARQISKADLLMLPVEPL